MYTSTITPNSDLEIFLRGEAGQRQSVKGVRNIQGGNRCFRLLYLHHNLHFIPISFISFLSPTVEIDEYLIMYLCTQGNHR